MSPGKIKDWQLALAEYFMEKGGQLKNVKQFFGEPAICVLTRISIEAGDLFKVFKKKLIHATKKKKLEEKIGI